MFRQLCDPLWCIEDPLMRAAVASLRSDHVVMGVSLSGLNDNPSQPPAAVSESSQQQLKLAQLNPMGSSATKTAPVAAPAVVSSATDPHLMQQLLAQLLVPNMAPPQHS
ncbi:unnamed protein product [Nippostrongylus brasiliensis]|uniref:CSTF2_hinge domain-containing protein n=1 Tax=Nippostrongylus brasiliensis TaxID=27835 RepID=A0A0N4XCW0_NIPBR|nr:unnamed protein product [Nippostrongylus brasiliensis]